jgi:hypothetical protein
VYLFVCHICISDLHLQYLTIWSPRRAPSPDCPNNFGEALIDSSKCSSVFIIANLHVHTGSQCIKEALFKVASTKGIIFDSWSEEFCAELLYCTPALRSDEKVCQ